MNKIVSIEGLIKHLNLCTGNRCYLDVMQQIDIPAEAFERYYHWNPQHHTRTLLYGNEKYELVLACWEQGQQSSIHDYDAHEAWTLPIHGKLREERFVLNEEANGLHKVSSVLLGPGEFSYLQAPVDIHRYTNAYESRTVTLHLYATPVEQWHLYTEQDGDTGYKPVWYDAKPTAEEAPIG